MATFQISEADFLKVFTGVQFREIEEKRGYITEGFGLLSEHPWGKQYNEYAKNGLFYESIPNPNGSVTRILYDRATRVAFFYSAAW